MWKLRSLVGVLALVVFPQFASAQNLKGQYQFGGGKFTFKWEVNIAQPVGGDIFDLLADSLRKEREKRQLDELTRQINELAQQVKQAVEHSPPDVSALIGLISPVPKRWPPARNDGKAWFFPLVPPEIIRFLGDVHENEWPGSDGVPILVTLLQAEWGNIVQGHAAEALAKFGADAEAAVPVLEGLLAANRNLDANWKQGTTRRTSFTTALAKIKADAAARKIEADAAATKIEAEWADGYREMVANIDQKDSLTITDTFISATGTAMCINGSGTQFKESESHKAMCVVVKINNKLFYLEPGESFAKKMLSSTLHKYYHTKPQRVSVVGQITEKSDNIYIINNFTLTHSRVEE
jgi:hypothetical protein